MQLCNFVLTLAVFFNDFKDNAWAYHQLRLGQTNDPPYTRYQGEYTGMQNHLFKSICSLFHELLNLISDNLNTLKHPDFMEIDRKLNRADKSTWNDLLALSADKDDSSDPEFRQILLLIRHKLCGHLSQHEVGRGYKHGFYKTDGSKVSEAFISRGLTMNDTRLYFADVPVIGYMDKVIKGKMTAVKFFEKLNIIQRKVNSALMSIAYNYIIVRDGAYHKFQEEKAVAK